MKITDNGEMSLPTGLLFDGYLGKREVALRVIELAIDWGLTLTDDDSEGSARLEADEAEASTYLEKYAPEGFWVGWECGDFGVWEEEYDGDFGQLHPGDSTEEDNPYHNG